MGRFRLGHACRSLLSVTGLVLGLAGCGVSRDDIAPLWQEEARWAHTPLGWIQAVDLATPRALKVDLGESRRFRALAVPGAGGATLRISLDGGPLEVRQIQQPSPLDLDLGQTDDLILAAKGPLFLLRPRLVPPSRQGRRVVLAVADTLRADHAGWQHMPRLSAYFADGFRFERAYSAAAWTLPSVAALFTGVRPTRLRSPDGTLVSLAADTPTLARGFADRGWATAAVVANVTVNHENGFSQGFSLFVAPSAGGGGSVSGKVNDAPDVTWLAKQAILIDGWLNDEDLLLYLQPMDTHDPYRPRDRSHPLPAPLSGESLDAAALADLRSAYADEVEHLDLHLGALFEQLGEVETAVFTADHGEELFDHGGFRHGPTLHDEVVKVPLWMRGEGIEAGTSTQPISLMSLRSLLLARADGTATALDALWNPDQAVTMETFTFGPPRFSAVVGEQRPILYARPLEPRTPGHPIEAWLRQTQRPIQVLKEGRESQTSSSDSAGVAPGLLDRFLARQVVTQLVEQYRGFRQGLFLLLEPTRRLRLRITGVGDDGWYWGDGTIEAHRVAERLSPDQLDLDLLASPPFLLVFLPEIDALEPTVENLDTGSILDPQGGIDQPGLRLWLDPGRPSEDLAGQEITLQRLRALGYI